MIYSGIAVGIDDTAQVALAIIGAGRDHLAGLFHKLQRVLAIVEKIGDVPVGAGDLRDVAHLAVMEYGFLGGRGVGVVMQHFSKGPALIPGVVGSPYSFII